MFFHRCFSFSLLDFAISPQFHLSKALQLLCSQNGRSCSPSESSPAGPRWRYFQSWPKVWDSPSLAPATSPKGWPQRPTSPRREDPFFKGPKWRSRMTNTFLRPALPKLLCNFYSLFHVFGMSLAVFVIKTDPCKVLGGEEQQKHSLLLFHILSSFCGGPTLQKENVQIKLYLIFLNFVEQQGSSEKTISLSKSSKTSHSFCATEVAISRSVSAGSKPGGGRKPLSTSTACTEVEAASWLLTSAVYLLDTPPAVAVLADFCATSHQSGIRFWRHFSVPPLWFH